ncbi:MAG: GNAT family N-acetyltransferase [Candidatus Lokiarchaeota archaeon]|nr:GNAT family N-acetyltransferase [Candidatus Lokiarchaeota archaeon]
MLVGTCVDLVPVERAHLPLIVKWLNDPEVTHFLNWFLPLNLDGEEKWFTGLAGNQKELVFTIALKVERILEGRRIGSLPIGQCAIRLDWKNRVGNLGMVIGEKEHWGKGFGTEAMRLLVDYGFGTLGMNRMELETFDFNERAIKAFSKVGFKEEGRRRQAHYIDGRFNDVVFMGLIQGEWRAREAPSKP